MKKTFISIMSVSLLLGSCSKDECDRQVDNPLSPVIFSPGISSIQESRASKLTWDDGDAIAIFSDIAVKGDNLPSTAAIIYTRGSAAWNSPNVNERWYWANAVDEHNFYAYYPSTAIASSYSAVEIPDIAAPDGTKSLEVLKEENDFMRGSATAYKGDELMTAIQMIRVFAIINLNVKLKTDAFTGNTATLSAVNLTSATALPLANATSSDKATVNLPNGQVTCTTSVQTLTLAPQAGFALNNTTPLSIPVKIFPHNGKIQIQFTIGGKTSAVKELVTNTTNNTANFIGGSIYNYSIEIGAAPEIITTIGDPTIIDWVNNNIDGTITPEIPN